MGLYVNPNEANLKMDMNSKIYVDKSMMIAELNELVNTSARFVCIARPRRFGKTMIGNMIAAYYSKKANSRPLLEQLKLAKDPSFEKYLNQFNVIKVDVNAFYSNSDHNEDIVPLFTQAIRSNMMKEFPDVGIEDDDNLPQCIQKVYEKTGETFVIIMDEYDVLVREQVKASIFKPYLAFLNGMFKNADLAPAISLAYLTGVLPIVRDKIQSKLNLFTEYTMMRARNLTEFVGFTEDEVKTLCNQHYRSFNECERWYDGYKLKDYNIYNPKSIVEAMLTGEYDSYWTATGAYDALKIYIMMNFKGIVDDVKTMIAGGRVDVDVTSYLNTMTDFRFKDDVFTYLIHLGYLAYDSVHEQCYIPNEEVRREWVKSIREEDDYIKAFDIITASKRLLDLTVEGDEAAVAAALDAAHQELSSTQRYNHEANFQCMIRLAYFYANTRYTVVSELPAGKGYADVAFIPYLPNIPAMIVELKRNASTGTALNQIKEKRYFDALDNYSGELLFVGVNYDEATKVHSCKIERFIK